jgi:hypothetical protein
MSEIHDALSDYIGASIAHARAPKAARDALWANVVRTRRDLQQQVLKADRLAAEHAALVAAVRAYLAECDAKETTLDDVMFQRQRMRDALPKEE